MEIVTLGFLTPGRVQSGLSSVVLVGRMACRGRSLTGL
jgi:hypothetical protein